VLKLYIDIAVYQYFDITVYCQYPYRCIYMLILHNVQFHLSVVNCLE